MPWLRMFFKHKIKVYAEVDANLSPVVDERGLVQYRYQNTINAQAYSTQKSQLSMIPGAEPVELGEEVTKPPKAPKPRKTPVSEVSQVVPDDTLPPNTIVVYTDGGASPNPGPAGSGILLLYNKMSLEIWEYLGNSTNNIAELTAVLIALKNIKNKKLPILLYSDSSYTIGVLTGTMKATKNLDLIEEIRTEMAKCPNLKLLKVKAHVGVAHNEHVDRLVALARDTRQSGVRRSS